MGRRRKSVPKPRSKLAKQDRVDLDGLDVHEHQIMGVVGGKQKILEIYFTILQNGQITMIVVAFGFVSHWKSPKIHNPKDFESPGWQRMNQETQTSKRLEFSHFWSFTQV